MFCILSPLQDVNHGQQLAVIGCDGKVGPYEDKPFFGGRAVTGALWWYGIVPGNPATHCDEGGNPSVESRQATLVFNLTLPYTLSSRCVNDVFVFRIDSPLRPIRCILWKRDVRERRLDCHREQRLGILRQPEGHASMVMGGVTRGLAHTLTMELEEASNAGCHRIASHQCLLTWETTPTPSLVARGRGRHALFAW